MNIPGLTFNRCARICLGCPLRSRTATDRATCTVNGKNAYENAANLTCPAGRFPQIKPPQDGELNAYLSSNVAKPLGNGWAILPEVQAAYRLALTDAVKGFSEFKTNIAGGKGIVICAGGTYALSGLLTLKLIRATGCNLPCEMWRLPSETVKDWHRQAAENLNVTFRSPSLPMRNEHGWALKSRAMLETSFDEVMFRDSDSYDLGDPSGLFASPEYQQTGALVWPDPDYYRLCPAVWEALGMAYRDEPTFEAGQFTIDRARHWKAIQLWDWMNGHSEYYWVVGPRGPVANGEQTCQGPYGDKDTLHLAFRYLSSDYFIVPRPYETKDPAVIHFSLDGKVPLIVHRIHGKAVARLSDTSAMLSWQKAERNDELPSEALYWHYFDELLGMVPASETEPEPPPVPQLKPKRQEERPCIGCGQKHLPKDWIAPKLPTLALATLWTADLAEVAAITLPTIRTYCAHWKFPLIELTEKHQKAMDRPAQWSKIPLLLDHLAQHDWLWWIDADIMIMNQHINALQFLDDAYDLIWTEDNNGPNTGSFFIKNTPASIQLLTEAQELYGKVETHNAKGQFQGRWDQAAIRHLIDAGAAVKVKTLFKRTFNAYHTDYQATDFVCHFVSDGKLDKIKEFLANKPALPSKRSVVMEPPMPPKPGCRGCQRTSKRPT